jgi:hypothetical protein
MRFGSIGYNVSTFLVIVLLMVHTMVMTMLISDQRGVELPTMLMLYANIAFICVMIQVHVSSRSNRSV